jgi:hypothetical protein
MAGETQMVLMTRPLSAFLPILTSPFMRGQPPRRLPLAAANRRAAFDD